jgi:hypothetical protein
LSPSVLPNLGDTYVRVPDCPCREAAQKPSMLDIRPLQLHVRVEIDQARPCITELLLLCRTGPTQSVDCMHSTKKKKQRFHASLGLNKANINCMYDEESSLGVVGPPMTSHRYDAPNDLCLFQRTMVNVAGGRISNIGITHCIHILGRC